MDGHGATGGPRGRLRKPDTQGTGAQPWRGGFSHETRSGLGTCGAVRQEAWLVSHESVGLGDSSPRRSCKPRRARGEKRVAAFREVVRGFR